MMQLNKILFYALFLIYVTSVCLYAGHDIDIKYAVTGGERNAGDGLLKEWQGALFLDYSSNIQLSKTLSLLLGETLDGMTAATARSPYRQMNNPANSISNIGLGYYGPVMIEATGFSHFLFNNSQIGFPVDKTSQSYLLDASILQKNKTGIDVYFSLPARNRMALEADILYTNLTYNLYRDDVEETRRHDADLWATGSLSLSLGKKKSFGLLSGAVIKHDLNAYSGYNYSEGYLGMNLAQDFFRKKLNIRAALLGRMIINTIVEQKGYADNIGILPELRVMLKPKPRTFFKGDLEYEIAPSDYGKVFFKQRYELSYRKVSKKFSAFEIGGWGSFGSLLPRISLYGNGIIAAGKKVEIIPGIKGYLLGETQGEWRQVATLTSGFDSTTVTIKMENGQKVKIDRYGNKFLYENVFNGFKYYRTDIDLIIRYKIRSEKSSFFRNMALYMGLQFQLYQKLPSFADSFESANVSRRGVYIGITNYL